MRSIAVWLISLLFVAAASAQGLPLDKLSACDAMDALTAWLDAAAQAPVENCRQPRDATERSLFKFEGLLSEPGSKACMLDKSPLGKWSGFNCFAVTRPKIDASLFCFRSQLAGPVDGYKPNYRTQYAAKVASYLDKAGSCPAISQIGRKKIVAALSIPSLSLTSIAKLEFGFDAVLRLKSGHIGNVEHGFGKLNPKLSNNSNAAIEYISGEATVGNAPEISNTSSSLVKEWEIETLVVPNILSSLKQLADRDPNDDIEAPPDLDPSMEFSAAIYSVTSNGSQDRSDAEKIGLQKKWQQGVAAQFAKDKYTVVPEAELKSMGLDSSMFSSMIGSMLPYGFQEIAQRKAPTLGAAWVNEGAACANGGDGGIMAMTLQFPPAPNQRSNYGAIGLMALGMGKCAKSKGGPGAAATVERISKAFVQNMEGY